MWNLWICDHVALTTKHNEILRCRGGPFLHQAKLHRFVEAMSSKPSFIKSHNGTVTAHFLELIKLQKATAICVIIVEGKCCSLFASERIQDVNCLRVSSCGAQEKLLKVQLPIAVAIHCIEK